MNLVVASTIKTITANRIKIRLIITPCLYVLRQGECHSPPLRRVELLSLLARMIPLGGTTNTMIRKMLITVQMHNFNHNL
ncbi:Uncharacterised protein [Vibrio cholerae]|nr:Uncharacterised protein [Vibrio cholerae]